MTKTTWKQIINRIIKTHKKAAKHKLHKKQKKQHLSPNIFDDTTVHDFNKKYKWIHYFLKYKIIVPTLLILEKLCGDRIIREYKTNKWHNKPLQRFDEDFEKALKNWVMYLKTLSPKIKTRKAYREGTSSIGLLRLMKNLVLTVASHDDVYIEFLNMLQNEMMNRKNKARKHLLHNTSEVNGPNYMVYYVLGEYLENDKIILKKLKTFK